MCPSTGIIVTRVPRENADTASTSGPTKNSSALKRHVFAERHELNLAIHRGGARRAVSSMNAAL